MNSFLKRFLAVLSYKEPKVNFNQEKPYLILNGFLETLKLILPATFFSFVIGLFLGIFLYIIRIKKTYFKNKIYYLINFIFNLLMSAPFLAFSILIIKKFLGPYFNLYYGFEAAFFCLIFILIPIFARNCEQIFLELDENIYETSYMLGANRFQFVRYFIIRESIQSIILKTISLFISCLAYASVLGPIGINGLGEIVYRYGLQSPPYHRQANNFTNEDVIFVCIFINLLMVCIIYLIGIIINNIINNNKK
ncbi:ABC-type methionine transport system, permease component [Candidatus Phytoplasma mali]|uniref:ABC-type methionine transport system, permease component n=1 Tax=Phytoplasma mali (strain AT) TaxID=482235 RepID=B3R0L4_PHYMT|nr:ABC transporter permease subunit [Candidatus Phytoplasma mali]CAP18378.1 ABC-type methionine transport system, permease component [Candidatus Phytoplasma mali]